MIDAKFELWIEKKVEEIFDSYWDYWIKNHAMHGTGVPPTVRSKEDDDALELAIAKYLNLEDV